MHARPVNSEGFEIIQKNLQLCGFFAVGILAFSLKETYKDYLDNYL
jgi:hypothetical protein